MIRSSIIAMSFALVLAGCESDDETTAPKKVVAPMVLVAPAGFAGSTADAFALMERFEAKLKDYPNNVPRAATELARDWRTDRMLRRLEAMLIVANDEHSLLITGVGDVIQPTDGVLGIGSGSTYAIAAARALARNTKLSAGEIVKESMRIAAELDIYTNDNLVLEEFPCKR